MGRRRQTANGSAKDGPLRKLSFSSHAVSFAITSLVIGHPMSLDLHLPACRTTRDHCMHTTLMDMCYNLKLKGADTSASDNDQGR